MAATTDRRRNLRADNCRACGTHVGAGRGWLYRDTAAKVVRRLGRFGWCVKCDACHANGETRATIKAASHAAAKLPAPRAWSVSQVKSWSVEIGEHGGEHDRDTAVWLVGPFGREQVGYRDSMTSIFTGKTGWELEEASAGGRPLSKAAAEYLSPAVLAAITTVQEQENAAAVAAAKQVAEAGGEVEWWHSNQFCVSIPGEQTKANCFGQYDGTCGVYGPTGGVHNTMTVEELCRRFAK